MTDIHYQMLLTYGNFLQFWMKLNFCGIALKYKYRKNPK